MLLLEEPVKVDMIYCVRDLVCGNGGKFGGFLRIWVF